MAGNSVFAPKYAHAFASVVSSAGLDARSAKQQMLDFATTLAESKELREVMMDPSIAADQKLAVLDALSERLGMMREVRNFFAVIIDHQRIGDVGEIVDAYSLVADEDSGVAEAEIVSAHELNGDDRATLEAQVVKLAGSQIRVQYKVDSTLLGGAIVKIGSTVYDGSLRAQLDEMKRSLVTA